MPRKAEEHIPFLARMERHLVMCTVTWTTYVKPTQHLVTTLPTSQRPTSKQRIHEWPCNITSITKKGKQTQHTTKSMASIWKKQGNNMNSSLLRTLQLLPYQTVSCTKIPPLRRHRLKFTRVQPWTANYIQGRPLLLRVILICCNQPDLIQTEWVSRIHPCSIISEQLINHLLYLWCRRLKRPGVQPALYKNSS